MSDQNQNVQELIKQLKISDPEKQALSEKLASGGVTESLLSEIQKHVDRMNPLHPDNSPKEVKDLVQVEADFNAQMDAIEKDGDELEKNINTQLDQVDIDSTRQAINEVK